MFYLLRWDNNRVHVDVASSSWQTWFQAKHETIFIDNISITSPPSDMANRISQILISALKSIQAIQTHRVASVSNFAMAQPIFVAAAADLQLFEAQMVNRDYTTNPHFPGHSDVRITRRISFFSELAQ